MIGIIIPGIPLFQGTLIKTNTISFGLKDPKQIYQIGLFQTSKFSDDSCVSLYYSIPPFDEIILLGTISNNRPSDIFYTGWSLNSNVSIYDEIRIIAKMDKIANIEKDFFDKNTMDYHQSFIKTSLNNINTYLDSHNQSKNKLNDNFILPTNILDLWYQQYLQKLNIDYQKE